MKPAFFLASIFLSISAVAQPVHSPEVHEDRTVTFRLRAPQATEVKLHCESVTNSAMEKGADGIWSYTIPAREPDIYTYTFEVDGARLTDPNNPLLKYNLLNNESELHVPGPQSLPWELNDVPHGVLHHHFYKSTVAADDRDYIVYTPPGYDAAAGKSYPVLYLLHGYSDDTSAWSTAGRANTILDNLIAQHQARPMIVVMPSGYGTMEIVRGGWNGVRRAGISRENTEKFRDSLLQEVIPQVEKEYKTMADREHRAIAGLSMGGAESLFVGLNAPEKFAAVGAFSAGGAGTNYDTVYPKLAGESAKQPQMLWMACGTEDRLVEPNRKFCAWLKSKDVKYTWTETQGIHSFRVWRRYLAQFAPLLFRDDKS